MDETRMMFKEILNLNKINLEDFFTQTYKLGLFISCNMEHTCSNSHEEQIGPHEIVTRMHKFLGDFELLAPETDIPFVKIQLHFAKPLVGNLFLCLKCSFKYLNYATCFLFEDYVTRELKLRDCYFCHFCDEKLYEILGF